MGDVPRGSDNLVARAYDNDSKNFTDRVQIDFGLTVDILKGLTFKTTNSYNVTNKSSWDYSPRNERTITSDGLDTFSMEMSRSSDWNSENYFNYILDTKGHHINVMVGQSFNQSVDGFELKGSAKDFPADNYRDIASTLNSTTKNVEGALKVKTTSLSYFGRLIYSYKDKYLFTGTIRRDGSSAFGRTNRWGTFPSASVAWRLNEESFIKNLNIFSNLKFRIGWGKTGSSYGDGSKSIAQISTSKMYYYWWNGVNYTEQMGAAKDKEIDTNLHWETNEQTNWGIDMGFMDNALNVTLDYFIRNSYDLLLDRNMRPSTGFTSIYTNAGKIQNKGFELNVNSINIQTRDFTWNTNFNISFIKNTLKSLASGVDAMYARSGFDSNFTAYDYIAKVGESLGLIYGYEFDGIYQSSDFYTKPGDPTLYLKDGVVNDPRYSTKEPLRPGVVKYKDQDGDGKITTKDRTVIGSAIPKWYGGITNTLNYKGIDFSFMLQFNYGNDVYNATRLYSTQSRSGRRNMLAEVADRWSPTNASNKVPLYNGYITNDVYSRFVEDGSFLRLKNITLGYTLPKKWTSKFYVSRLRVYATGQNLFCVTGYSGYDPEVSTAGSNPMTPGLDWGAYPKSKVFTFGLDIQF